MVFRLFWMIRGKTLSASARLVQGNFGALWSNSNWARLKNHYHCLMNIYCHSLILIFIHCSSNKQTLRRLQIITFLYILQLCLTEHVMVCVLMTADGLTLLNKSHNQMRLHILEKCEGLVTNLHLITKNSNSHVGKWAYIKSGMEVVQQSHYEWYYERNYFWRIQIKKKWCAWLQCPSLKQKWYAI